MFYTLANIFGATIAAIIMFIGMIWAFCYMCFRTDKHIKEKHDNLSTHETGYWPKFVGIFCAMPFIMCIEIVQFICKIISTFVKTICQVVCQFFGAILEMIGDIIGWDK